MLAMHPALPFPLPIVCWCSPLLMIRNRCGVCTTRSTHIESTWELRRVEVSSQGARIGSLCVMRSLAATPPSRRRTFCSRVCGSICWRMNFHDKSQKFALRVCVCVCVQVLYIYTDHGMFAWRLKNRLISLVERAQSYFRSYLMPRTFHQSRTATCAPYYNRVYLCLWCGVLI